MRPAPIRSEALDLEGFRQERAQSERPAEVHGRCCPSGGRRGGRRSNLGTECVPRRSDLRRSTLKAFVKSVPNRSGLQKYMDGVAPAAEGVADDAPISVRNASRADPI